MADFFSVSGPEYHIGVKMQVLGVVPTITGVIIRGNAACREKMFFAYNGFEGN
jgi:hypothetical protein